MSSAPATFASRPRCVDQGIGQATFGPAPASLPYYWQWPRTRGTGMLRRANDGPTAAKARGTRFSRKPKLTDYQALKRLAAGESCRQIAKPLRVHHATIARLTG